MREKVTKEYTEGSKRQERNKAGVGRTFER